MTASWPNWAKIFFNNKGVAAKETDNCANYPPDDAFGVGLIGKCLCNHSFSA